MDPDFFFSLNETEASVFLFLYRIKYFENGSRRPNFNEDSKQRFADAAKEVREELYKHLGV